jgi:hypothetical protein
MCEYALCKNGGEIPDPPHHGARISAFHHGCPPLFDTDGKKIILRTIVGKADLKEPGVIRASAVPPENKIS